MRDSFENSCAGKFAFGEKLHAERVKRDMLRTGRMLTKLDIYRCKHGNHYHIAHAQPPRPAKRQRNWFALLAEDGE